MSDQEYDSDSDSGYDPDYNYYLDYQDYCTELKEHEANIKCWELSETQAKQLEAELTLLRAELVKNEEKIAEKQEALGDVNCNILRCQNVENTNNMWED